MTQEEKQLLFKDLCTRLPYGIIVHIHDNDIADTDDYDRQLIGEDLDFIELDRRNCKPYLRPLSSMTEKEEEEFKQVLEIELDHLASKEVGHTVKSTASSAFEIDFYNKHHFDYRGLIEQGLALEAPEGMYKI